MRARVVACLFVVTAFAMSAVAAAQEAALSGTITDVSGAVLPGVTVTAVHEDSGNTFVGVSDERGQFRLPLRVGRYRVSAELSGFATVARSLELLVGQQAVTNLQMAPGTLQETVTVTGEAPLLETTQSTLGGNIDTRQMQEIPLAGRNWLDLVLLAPGAQGNAVAPGAPMSRAQEGNVRMMFQTTVDGQVTSQTVSFGQYGPRFSRDALAEFEVITNRFDATQGRAAAMQVNAVTRSGTNQFRGTLSGYFRDAKFMAADPVAGRVLPYANQQMAGTFGGPIRRDRAHFFAYYEGEREPQSLLFNSAFPSFNVVLPAFTRTEKKWGGRFDLQFTPSRRMMVRGNRYDSLLPMERAGATLHPAGMTRTEQWSNQVWTSFTQVLGSKGVFEGSGGYAYVNRPSVFVTQGTKGAECDLMPPSTPPGVRNPCVQPSISLRGYAVAGIGTVYPQIVGQESYQAKGSLSYVLSRAGTHQVKVGGEYIDVLAELDFSQIRYGSYDATGGPVPANIEGLLPVWNDHTTWNLNALNPIIVSYSQTLGAGAIRNPREVYAAWLQDDWSVTNRLTLNLGLRYDASIGSLGERVAALPPVRLEQDIHSDLNNIGPRLGVAYVLGADRQTVLRGGWGRFFTEIQDGNTHFSKTATDTVLAQVFNDGRPDFATNPFNNNPPTREQLLAAGGVRNFSNFIVDATDFETPWADTASVGVQRQIGETISVQADYIHRGQREEIYVDNGNLTYDPATGVNYSFRDVTRRRYPQFGLMSLRRTGAKENYQGLETAVTKRFGNRWQASGTYTVSKVESWRPCPNYMATCPEDLGNTWTPAVGEQRHRAVFNGIWELPYEFQLSGLYFYGSGERYGTSTGAGDVRQQGASTSTRIRANGTIMPANDFVGRPLHRMDLRVQKRFRLGGRSSAEAMIETFNLFNHANYGAYTTVESSPRYGLPSQVDIAGGQNVAYVPRMLQFGFRIAF